MPLNEQDQLSLLQDILKNHQVDCCGTVSECEQLERIIQSLNNNQQINQQVKDILIDVFSYSQQGQNADNINDYINNHKEDISQWIDNLNNSNLT